MTRRLGGTAKAFILFSRIILWAGAFTGAILLVDYSLDAYKRRSRGSDCVWNLIEKERNFSYVARYCHLTKDTAILRLYNANEDVLLAERMYSEWNFVKINLIGNKLFYSNSESDFISLPPTLLDGFRAKLP